MFFILVLLLNLIFKLNIGKIGYDKIKIIKLI